MSKALFLTPVALVLALASIALSEGDDVFRPAGFYQSKCSACHTVPDSTHRTDRAWIGHVLTTT